MLDLLIRGGRVVTPAGVGELDVGVEGERIVAVGTPGSLPGGASRTTDAIGKLMGGPGDGQLIPRKMASEVISRPAC